MKSPFKKGQILIVLIGILVVISLNFFQKEVKNFFYLISSPIQENLWQGGSNISGFFEGFFKAAALEEENEELRFKIQELLAENIKLSEL